MRLVLALFLIAWAPEVMARVSGANLIQFECQAALRIQVNVTRHTEAAKSFLPEFMTELAHEVHELIPASMTAPNRALVININPTVNPRFKSTAFTPQNTVNVSASG